MKQLLPTTLNIPAIYPDIYREGLWVVSVLWVSSRLNKEHFQ